MNQTPNQDLLDQVTSERLAKLATRPIDTSHLENRLEAALHDEVGPTKTPTGWLMLWSRPLIGFAAAMLILGSVAFVVLQFSGASAMAAPSGLAEIHFDVTHGFTPHLEVSTIEEANRILAEQSSDFVALPQLPGNLQSCCLHEHAGKMLTCAVVEHKGQLATIAVARGADLRSPEGDELNFGNQTYVVHRANGITMVMRSEADRWLCVMGQTSPEVLAEIAEEIAF